MDAVNAERTTHILLVDDDARDVEAIQQAFQKANIRNPLQVAASGQEALRMLRSGEIPAQRRVVLLDLDMPPRSGLETLREIRRDPALSSLSVVMLTTSSEERDRVEAYSLHVAGYLLKPTSAEGFVELMATLNRYWSLLEFP